MQVSLKKCMTQFCNKLYNKGKKELQFPLAPMGVLAHHLRTLDRLLVPPLT